MHVLDDDDIMGNLFASFGYLNTEKLCFFLYQDFPKLPEN